METVVFYNAGKSAKLAGLPRAVPETHEYPIVSRYEDFRTKTVRVEGSFAQAWLDGYDGKYDRKPRFKAGA